MWICGCGIENKDNKNICQGCGTTRDLKREALEKAKAELYQNWDVPVDGEVCMNCRYSFKIDTDKGFCRRYPPTLITDGVIGVPGLGIGVAEPLSRYEFPVIHRFNWCGEWKQKTV